MLGDTAKVVAFAVVQFSVTSDPAVTDVALAVKVTVGAAVLTFTITVLLALPPAPLATAVNVVSAFTVTCCEPERGRAPLLMEGVIVTDVAFVADHVSVTVPPALTLLVSAVKLNEGRAGGWFVEEEVLPPHAAKEINSKSKARAEKQRDNTGDSSNQESGSGVFDSAALS
jgi:hypothetical protein